MKNARLLLAPCLLLAALALAEAPPEERALYQKGIELVRHDNGRGELLFKAAAVFQELLGKNPRSALAYTGLAIVCYQNGYSSGDDYDPDALARAESLALKALELDPNEFDAHATEGRIAFYQHQNTRLLQRIEAMKTLRPDAPETDLLLAEMQASLGFTETALQSCERAIERDKAGALGTKPHLIALRNYQQLGQYEKAAAHARKCIELDPASAWARGNYARLLNDMGDFDQAISLSKQAIAIMDYGAAHCYLGAAYEGKARGLMRKKQLPEAKSYFELALRERAPNLASATSGLGLCLLALAGQAEAPEPLRQQAAKAFRQALALNPGLREAKSGLARSLAPPPPPEAWLDARILGLGLLPLLLSALILLRWRRKKGENNKGSGP